MAELTSGQVNFAGLGNGTDFNALVDGLVQIERNRVTRLQNWKQEWTDKVSIFQELNSKMLSLRTTLTSMDSVNEFMTKTITSSSEQVLTASADADASTSSHVIEVNQLAQNKIMTGTSGYASNAAYVNQTGSAQDFSYTYKGETITVSIANSTTLEGFVNAINNDSDNPGVRAAIISNGSEKFIQFRGMDMGADASLDINDAGTTLAGFASADFETVQANQNSQIKVDGWPTGAGQYISNASNTITDAIDGVTLNLKSASPGSTVTLTVETDMEGIKDNIRNFVKSVNEVRAYINAITKVDENAGNTVSTSNSTTQEKKGSILTGNYGVQIISQKLKDATAGLGIGFDYYDTTGASPTGDRFSALSQLGILTDASQGSETQGQLLLDEEELDKALETDFDAVVSLFAADGVGGTKNTSDFAYVSKIDALTKPGQYEVSYKIDASGDIYDAYINGYPATINNTTHELTAQSDKTTIGDTTIENNGAVGLVLRVDNLTQGEYPPAGTSSSDHPMVTIKQGKVGEMVDSLEELTNDDTGPLAILEDNYDDIMDSIDKKIAYEEDRITKLERTWRLKYARLDALLGNYQNQTAALGASISQMAKDT